MSLEIKNLSKKYAKDYILSDLSYVFEDKGLYLILGKSGSGKTTLLRLISGLDEKYEGEIFGGGKHLCSFAFQEYRLFEHLSALENVYLESVNEVERARALLLSLGLLDEDCNSPAKDLSGGMKQRVSIARALFKKAPILCLDEPTKEIGKENTEKLIRIINEESKRRLVLIVTHTEEDFSGLEYKQIRL